MDLCLSLKLKVKGQGYQGQNTAFFGPFGSLHALASSYFQTTISTTYSSVGILLHILGAQRGSL